MNRIHVESWESKNTLDRDRAEQVVLGHECKDAHGTSQQEMQIRTERRGGTTCWTDLQCCAKNLEEN